ncbi:hypothetical protein BDV93DRAFT_567088 [Ceratobasidium sp. AG-I]|nr:hypothetical protein BDV93DRAFT_567088 [Ceratobasidium sp. AG-I]
MPDKKSDLFKLTDVVWTYVCIITLGFPAKYSQRLVLFEDLVPRNSDGQALERWSTSPEFSDRGDKGKGSQKTMREKQQEEWDRLNIAVSVITATSAAALAIQATSIETEIYWLVTAFYSIAFGLSLQGLILITYLTVAAGGSSDEAIGRLAQGTLLSDMAMTVKPVAITMALPAILATYSSIALLVGLVAMVVVGPGPGVGSNSAQYILVTIIPVGLAFVFLCISVVMCEVGNLVEARGRRHYLRHHNGKYNDPPPAKQFEELEKILQNLAEVMLANASSKTWKTLNTVPSAP